MSQESINDLITEAEWQQIKDSLTCINSFCAAIGLLLKLRQGIFPDLTTAYEQTRDQPEREEHLLGLITAYDYLYNHSKDFNLTNIE